MWIEIKTTFLKKREKNAFEYITYNQCKANKIDFLCQSVIVRSLILILW